MISDCAVCHFFNLTIKLRRQALELGLKARTPRPFRREVGFLWDRTKPVPVSGTRKKESPGPFHRSGVRDPAGAFGGQTRLKDVSQEDLSEVPLLALPVPATDAEKPDERDGEEEEAEDRGDPDQADPGQGTPQPQLGKDEPGGRGGGRQVEPVDTGDEGVGSGFVARPGFRRLQASPGGIGLPFRDPSPGAEHELRKNIDQASLRRDPHVSVVGSHEAAHFLLGLMEGDPGVLDQFGGGEDAAPGPDQADHAPVLLALGGPWCVRPEDEGEDLLDEGHLLLAPISSPAVPLLPAMTVVGPAPPPAGPPEEVPDPEARHSSTAPPAQAEVPAPAPAASPGLAGHHRRYEEGDEEHEVDHQHEDDPYLERLPENGSTPAGQSTQQRLGVTLQELWVKPVDQSSGLAHLHVAPAAFQEVPEDGFHLVTGHPRIRDHVTHRHAAPGFLQSGEDGGRISG